VVYLAALAPIVLIYSTKERALVVAPPIGLICAAATWFLLGDTPANRERRLFLAAGVGIVAAELAWGLGYWAVAPVIGGAALWLVFYVLSGIVEHGAAQTLDRRIALEYGFVATLGMLILLVFMLLFLPPWRVQVG
jgi:F0F1-type ATP synthase assembly protein I